MNLSQSYPHFINRVSEFRCVMRNEQAGNACVSADCSERLAVFSVRKRNILTFPVSPLTITRT